MVRKVNAETLSHVKSFEGLRLEAYPDPGSSNGQPYTIGYGSTRGVVKGMKITPAQAEQRLVADLITAENAVERLVKVPLTDNQFGALVSFVFNVGAGAFEDSTLLRLLNAGDYAAVPAQLPRWNQNDGKVMAGLTRRRAAEAALWNGSAVPVAPQPADPIPAIPVEPLPAAPRRGIGVIGAVALLAAIIIIGWVAYSILT